MLESRRVQHERLTEPFQTTWHSKKVIYEQLIRKAFEWLIPRHVNTIQIQQYLNSHRHAVKKQKGDKTLKYENLKGNRLIHKDVAIKPHDEGVWGKGYNGQLLLVFRIQHFNNRAQLILLNGVVLYDPWFLWLRCITVSGIFVYMHNNRVTGC